MEKKRIFFSSLSVIVVVIMVLVFSACKISGGGGDVSVTGVSLNISNTTLTVGETVTLVATVSPSDAANKNVSWESLTPTVATVSADGVVTAESAGLAVIQVTTEDGGFVAGCDVTVEEVILGSGDIFVAGYYEGISNDVSTYWVNDKDGQNDLFVLDNSRSRSIFVSGGNVYVAGWYTNVDETKVACYWVNNGDPVDLHNDSTAGYDAEATSIFVSGSDVYVAGFYEDDVGSGVKKIASYWVNDSDSEASLTDGSYDSEALSIYYDGSDIYTAGYYLNVGGETACYWENSVIKTLDTGLYARAESITVQSGNVYTAGEYYDSAVIKACYWLNDSSGPTFLHDTTSYAYSIALDGSDVYVAGYYKGTNDVSCYWLNGGAPVDLYNVATAGYDSHASSIYISGSDIYIAGYYIDGDGKKSCYWKNGTTETLSDGTFPSQATSIFFDA